MGFFVLMLIAIVVPILICSFAMSYIKRRINNHYQSNKENDISTPQTTTMPGSSITRTPDCITVTVNKGLRKHTYRIYRDAENLFQFKLSYYPELTDPENAKIKNTLLRILQKDCPEVKVIT